MTGPGADEYTEMRTPAGWPRTVARVSLLAVLLIGCVVAYLQPYYAARADSSDNGAVTRTVTRGPVVFDTIRYTLTSITAHTQLLDDEGKPVEDGHPLKGAVYVTATLQVQPTADTVIGSSGYSCNVALIDSEGRRWDADDSAVLSTPTDCSDDKLTDGGTVTQVYEVPASAVPKIVGVVTDDVLSDEGQLLIRR